MWKKKLFWGRSDEEANVNGRGDFSYLPADQIYLDGACQSLRPEPVIVKLTSYYREFNACGGRGHYDYARKTDAEIAQVRELILKYLGLSAREYFTAFTLNTSYGLNLILNQIDGKKFRRVITSEIEHNSPFLATMTLAKRAGLERIVLPRREDGGVEIDGVDFNKAIVVMNCVSNVDGREMTNLKEVAKAVQEAGGVMIVDAAQAMAHNAAILRGAKPDAICFSGHKMYAPSVGGMIIKRSLLTKLEPSIIGGGMVDDVKKNSYELSAEKVDLAHTRFEVGLQAFGEIIALGEAIRWLENRSKKEQEELELRAKRLQQFLKDHPKARLVNPQSAATTMSVHFQGVDSHLLGAALADEKIMVRTGYFCVHYYLDHVRKLPPLVRFSLGYHNTDEDIKRLIKQLEKL